MTRDDVIRLAREADCIHVNLSGDMAMATERLSRFADAIIESVAQHLEAFCARHGCSIGAASQRRAAIRTGITPDGD